MSGPEEQCYFVSIRDLEADKPNTWISHWMRDVSVASVVLSYQLKGVLEEDIRVRHDGSWSEFIKTGDLKGWD